MSNSLKYKEPFLFLAGSWFAALFSIPVFLIWNQTDKSPTTFIFFVVPPMIVSFVCGEAFGSEILLPNYIQSSKKALIKGLKISILTYMFFIPVFAVVFAVYLCIFSRNPHEWLTVQFIENLLKGLFYISIVGTIAFGWLLSILGAFAGWILYRFKLLQKIP